MDWLPSGIDFELFVKEYRLFLRKIKGDIEMYAKDRAANVELKDQVKRCICYRQMLGKKLKLNSLLNIRILNFEFLLTLKEHFELFHILYLLLPIPVLAPYPRHSSLISSLI